MYQKEKGSRVHQNATEMCDLKWSISTGMLFNKSKWANSKQWDVTSSFSIVWKRQRSLYQWKMVVKFHISYLSFWLLTFCWILCTLVPCALGLHLKLRLSKNAATGWGWLPKQWVISESSLVQIHVVTQHSKNLLGCVCKQDGVNEIVSIVSIMLLGASTTMKTPRVRHSAKRTKTVAVSRLFYRLLCSKQLPRVWNYASQWNTDFALPVPASLVSGKW